MWCPIKLYTKPETMASYRTFPPVGPIAGWGGRGCVVPLLTARSLLLTTLIGRHASKGEKVDHLEVAGDLTTPGRQRRAPSRLGR